MGYIRTAHSTLTAQKQPRRQGNKWSCVSANLCSSTEAGGTHPRDVVCWPLAGSKNQTFLFPSLTREISTVKFLLLLSNHPYTYRSFKHTYAHTETHTYAHRTRSAGKHFSVSKSVLDIFLCQHTRNDPIDFDLCKISQSKHIPQFIAVTSMVFQYCTLYSPSK